MTTAVDLSESRRPEIVALNVALIVIALLAVALRFVAR